jgi:hypothetical protein
MTSNVRARGRGRLCARLLQRCGVQPPSMRSLLLVVPLLAAAAAPGAAQQPTAIQPGHTVTGSLSPGDPTMMGQGPFRVYRLDATAGQRLVLTLQSSDFDAFLSVLRPVGGITEMLASDDDSGGEMNARLRWVVPATGPYFVLAHALGANTSGRYTLRVEEAAPPRPATPQAISTGEARRGTLTQQSPVLDNYGSDVFYDLYSIDGRAGQHLVITLDSDDFDAFLEFGPIIGNVVNVTHSDDDGGEGMNSRLRVTIPADGRYGVNARPLSADVFGSYTITVREAAPAAPRHVETNRDLDGSLADSDSEAWHYQGTAGEVLRIWMRSGSFDTVLELGRMEGGQFRTLAENDDENDESTDSLIEFTLPSAGEYVIRARAFHGGSAGAYTLRVDLSRS